MISQKHALGMLFCVKLFTPVLEYTSHQKKSIIVHTFYNNLHHIMFSINIIKTKHLKLL